MPVISCPSCRAELDLDPTDIGHRVECPTCRHLFVAEERSSPPARRERPTADDERVVLCDRCSERVTVLASDLGHEVECPLCRATFTPSRPDDVLPRYDDWEYQKDHRRDTRRRYDEDDEGYDSRDYLIEYAKKECKAAGTGMQVCGWLGIILAPVQMLQLAMPGGPGGNPDWLVVLIGGLILYQIVMGILQIIGGGQMKKAKSWGLCLAACISGLLSGPFCLGIIFGIMGIVKLANPRVRRGFRLNRSTYDLES